MARAKHKIASGGSRGGTQRVGRTNLNESFRNSVRELADQALRQALDQFSITERLITDHPALSGADKIDIFYHQIQSLSSQIADLLAAITEAETHRKSPPGEAARRHDVLTQLIGRLAQIEGVPFKELTNVVQALVGWARVRRELTTTLEEFTNTGLRPPVPELTPEQIEAVKRRGKERPWANRPNYHTGASGPFEWIRDNFGDWLPGLRRIHLKAADGQLNTAFLKTLSRAHGRLPDWLDLPSENEHRLRIAAFSNPVQMLLNKRQIDRKRKQHVRKLG